MNKFFNIIDYSFSIPYFDPTDLSEIKGLVVIDSDSSSSLATITIGKTKVLVDKNKLHVIVSKL